MRCLKLNIFAQRRPLHIFRDSKYLTQGFDVIVIGGGHSGCESSAASARCGSKTLLITQKASTIALMPCNPSFGGIGKGHLVREVDALDGVCPRICDQSAITFQALNRSQGPAVIGLRAQIDRDRYPKLMQDEIVNKTPNLYVLEASVNDLIIKEDAKNQQIIGGCVLDDGTVINSDSVIITTGTFLSGEIFCGASSKPAGRRGENASYALANTFKRLGIVLGRHKTGTSPRISAKSVNFSKFVTVPADQKPIPFSFMTEKIWIPLDKQLPTYVGQTNEKMANIVKNGVSKNRYYIGSEVNGPRYCPSMESKVMRFPDLKHRLYLEHDGLDTDVMYTQGCGMNFEPKLQLEVLRAIDGLENVEILQPGYGVAYDYVNARQLFPDLSVKKLPGLYLAGQINGTTGYEEAAAQGIIAGINASWLSNRRKGKDVPNEPLKIDRSQGYIGVLIDDLTSLGTSEPYRMFTSRVEFRLHLRPDNADLRLTELAHKYGAVSSERYSKFCEIRDKFNKCKETLESVKMSLGGWSKHFTRIMSAPKVKTGHQLLSNYDISLETLCNTLPDRFNEIRDFVGDEDLEERLKNDGRYSLQQERLSKRMEEVKTEINATLPDDLNYLQMTALNLECREKLDRLKPGNLAAASRIEGITPDAMINLLRYVRQNEQIRQTQ